MMAFAPLSWGAIGAPLANHLWQSTLFAAGAGLLTLMLKRNHAQARYGLWLAASAKFLIPFALLVGIGSHVGWSKASLANQPEFLFVMRQISQPFASVKSSHAGWTAVAVAVRILPIFLLIAWFCGSLAVLFSWWLRWRRMTATLCGVMPVNAGREIEALRQLERSVGTGKRIELVLSKSGLEPGILGILRPVLLLPVGISDRLTDAQLAAIITHELCHVRRRDNLAAAFHMVIEAIFWFHPLVWWIGARLVDERERACDEEVLRLGNEVQAYAEGILKVCEFYLELPLLCAAGVTGSNLQKRIEGIMAYHTARGLNLGKKLLLATIGIVAVLGPVAAGSVHPTSGRARAQLALGDLPALQSVSIKPKGPMSSAVPTGAQRTQHGGTTELTWTNTSLALLILAAYDLHWSQVLGGPAWIGGVADLTSSSERYDVSVVADSVDDSQIRLTLQELLATRFKLTFHRETKEAPVYELVVGKKGPKLNEAQSSSVGPGDATMTELGGHIHIEARRQTMGDLAHLLGFNTGRLVLDKTGITGVYDITLNWTQNPPSSIFTAVSDQLGLELNPQMAPVEVLVVDHAEQVVGGQ